MLKVGANNLQYYGRYSAPLRACVEFNACASKRALTRNNFGDEGLFERELTFRKRNPQRLLMGIADREIEPIWSLADNNKRLFMQHKYL